MKGFFQTLLLLVSALLLGCALLMSHWLAMPWTGIAGMVVLSASLLFAVKSRLTGMPRTTLSVAWISSLAVPVSLWLERHKSHALDFSYALLAWLVAAAVLSATVRLADGETKRRWCVLGMIWALSGSVTWLAASYLQNNRLAFHLAAMIAVALLMLCKSWFRLPFSVALGVNTLLLLLVGFPVADLFVRPSYRLDTQPETAKKFYSYEFARKDPAAFAAWWNYYINQVNQIQWRYMGDRFSKTNHLGYPVHLTPNCQGLLFQSVISINSMGFRGPEFPDEKGNAYRIVALGESTTFGMTLRANDKPWPEVLEQMIRNRLKPDRPVQVINAGLPAWDLQQNLGRLPTEILPLKPDMIISYHGYNGFYLLDRAMPRTHGHKQPGIQRASSEIARRCRIRLEDDALQTKPDSKVFHSIAWWFRSAGWRLRQRLSTTDSNC